MTQPVVNVDKLPGDDVYPDLIDSNASGIRKAGKAVAARGTRVNAHWKKLGAHYGAPETESLVGKLAPAEKAAARFGQRMGLAATALETFAEDARGIKKRAEEIRARAKTFLEGVVAHGITKSTYIPSQGGGYTKTDHLRWDQDSGAVAENDAILAEIKQLANDLQAAEARCADAITTAVGAEAVTVPGTSFDWNSVPAGTATPWGVTMGHRNENNDEATGRGMLTGLIGLTTSLMALGGWQNKTLTYDKLTSGGFNPFALEHSFALEGQSLLGVGKFAAGVSNLVNPVYAPITLLNLNSKGWLGDYSRATTGTAIEGGKAFLVWDKWKDDPYAARGELFVNLASLAIPGGGEAAAPVEVAARVGARAAEDAAGTSLRVGADAAADAAKAGTGAAADAARGGLSHLPGIALDARTGLGHAGAPAAADTGAAARAGGLGRAADDFSLERGPAVSDAPAPRTPPHVDTPERVAVNAEHGAPRPHTGDGRPDVVARDRAGDAGRETSRLAEGSRTAPERELVHAGGGTTTVDRVGTGAGAGRGGSDLPHEAPRPPAGEGPGAHPDGPAGPTTPDDRVPGSGPDHEAPSGDGSPLDGGADHGHGTDGANPEHPAQDPNHPTGTEGADHAPKEQLAVPERYAHLNEHRLESGTKGAWTKELHKPEADSVYVIDDRHVIVTDHEGRVAHVETQLHLEEGARNGYQQRVAGREFRLEYDQGGHLVGVQFGGPGEGINLVPMAKELNQAGKGSWYEMESQWADVLKKDPDADVRVEIDVAYPPGSKRPSQFDVIYSIDGGEDIVRTFEQ